MHQWYPENNHLNWIKGLSLKEINKNQSINNKEEEEKTTN